MDYLLNIACQRPPDFVIQRSGKPYLRRWYVVPRNQNANNYLHHITLDDEDRALHDHPWDNTTILLKGRYWEHTPGGVIMRQAGDVVHRKAADLHRLTVNGGEAWTLFITGPKVREWGFACPNGWVHWEDFVDSLDSGKIGKGCAQ